MCPSGANGDADAGVPIPPARGVLLKMNGPGFTVINMTLAVRVPPLPGLRRVLRFPEASLLVQRQ